MSLHDDERIRDRLAKVEDPTGFLVKLFAHSPVAFGVWTPDGRPLLTNQAFMDLFLSEPPPDYNVLEDNLLAANGMLAYFQRAFAGETVHVPTFWYDPRELTTVRVTEGRRLAISMTIFPLLKTSGEIEYVAATYRDDTELTLAAERLALGEERQRLAHQAARAGTFEWNIKTGVNTWTTELEAMYGLAPGEFGNTQQSWEQLVYVDDRPAALGRVQEAFSTFEPTEGEWRVVWPDGSVHWLFGRFQVLRDESGEPHRLIGVNLDVTERKAAEEARRRAEAATKASEESLRITLDSIGDAVIATDAKGRVTRMNPVAEKLTGWPRSEAAGRLLTDVFDIRNEETGATVENPADRVLREGAVVGLANHTLLVSRGGDARPIADSGAPIRDASGAIHGVVLVFRDMTAERIADDERMRALELAAENRRVQEANRLKSEFLASMSHELRTPLNAIIGFSELLYDGVAGELTVMQLEYVRDVVTSGRHLLTLVNDVLDLAKVEAGKLALYAEPLHISNIAHEVVTALGVMASAKQIEVTIDVDPLVDEVSLDRVRLRQVLYNYLSNALKFTNEGGCVAVRVRPEDATAIRIAVEDTGIGIAEAELSRLFVPFEQVPGRKAAQGTGLGLALTRRLAEAMGGSAGATSVLGRGSTFHVVLPRHMHQTSDLASLPHSATPSAAQILVIEDDDSDRAAIVRVLSGAGYSVDAVAQGRQAITMFEEGAYRAITLDLVLPDMSGIEVLRAIRASARGAHVPVVVVTMVVDAATAGFVVHDLLAKPLEEAALLASLDRAGVHPERAPRVLVVDDDGPSLRLMEATLREMGYAPESCASGEEGLAAATRAAPAAVVLDLLMPGMDGFEFLDRFRQVPALCDVPVIVWTIKDLTYAERQRLERSVVAILAKSGRSALVSALEAYLPRRTAFE